MPYFYQKCLRNPVGSFRRIHNLIIQRTTDKFAGNCPHLRRSRCRDLVRAPLPESPPEPLPESLSEPLPESLSERWHMVGRPAICLVPAPSLSAATKPICYRPVGRSAANLHRIDGTLHLDQSDATEPRLPQRYASAAALCSVHRRTGSGPALRGTASTIQARQPPSSGPIPPRCPRPPIFNWTHVRQRSRRAS